MKEKTYSVTFAYDMGDGWMMDIVCPKENYWEAWIYRKNHGMKTFMFGCGKQKTCKNLDEFIEMAEDEFGGYISAYEEDDDVLNAYYDVKFKHDR